MVLDIVETDAAVEAIIKFSKMLEARAIKNKVEAAEREQADVRPRVFEPACSTAFPPFRVGGTPLRGLLRGPDPTDVSPALAGCRSQRMRTRCG